MTPDPITLTLDPILEDLNQLLDDVDRNRAPWDEVEGEIIHQLIRLSWVCKTADVPTLSGQVSGVLDRLEDYPTSNDKLQIYQARVRHQLGGYRHA